MLNHLCIPTTKMNLSNIKIELGRRAVVTESTNAKSSAVRRAPAKLTHAEQQRGDPFENVRRHFKELISRSGNSAIKKQHLLKPIVTRKKIVARFPQASSSKVLYLSKAQIGRKLAAPSDSSILERIKRRQPVKKKRGRSKKVRAQPPSLAADQMQSIVMEANDDEDEKVQMCQYPGNECGLPAFGSVGLCINHAPPDPQYGLMQCRYPMDSSKLRCPKSISLLHSQTGLCEQHEEVILHMELDKRKDARRKNARYIADKELESFMEYLKKPKRNVKRKQDTSPLNNTFSSMDESSETESEPEMEIMKTSLPVPDLPYHCLLEDDGPFRRVQILTQLAAALTMKYQLRMVQSGWQGQEETSVEDRWNISVEKCQNSSRLFVRNQSEVLRYMALEKDRLENTSTCSYEIFGQRICDRYALPLLNYCDKHAYVEKKQHLFKKCTFPKCTVSAVVTEKYCAEHALITRLKSPNRELARDGIKAALEKNDEELLQKLKDFGLGSDFLTHLRRFRTARFPYQDWKALAEKQRGVKKKSDESADSNIQSCPVDWCFLIQ
ncbi:Protein crossbronx-like [Trichinella spiralis]|uniref:Protein crossbronx-like n=1 Tax=Trichinella spiralis TaxID=6334 RepID=A0ABR3KBL2_TRISP